MSYAINAIGNIFCGDEGYYVKLKSEYVPATLGLDGFSHIQLIWWFNGCDNAADRAVLQIEKPYKKGPEALGAFATRSPCRPNPVALSCARITYIANDIIGLDYIDARDGSPVIDIKPYTPSLDFPESASVPGWCAHWPDSREKSGDFDWESEFNF